VSAHQCLDQEIINMLKDVMEDEFSVLVETYLNDGDVRINTLRDTLAAQDADAVSRCAHSLKGSSSNVGAAYLANLCLEVETRALDGQLAGLELYVDKIEQEFIVVKQALSEI